MKIDKTLVLTTENLRLRIPLLQDIPHIFSATRYSGFNDGMLWEAPKDKQELIESHNKGIKSWEAGNAYGFTVEDWKTKTFLGRISIRKTNTDDKWNIGFWTHPEHQRKGIMTEALQVVLDFGFETLKAKSIEASHAVWNKGSEKVLLKNGMKFSRYIDKGFQKHGKWIDEHLLKLSLSDWHELRMECKHILK